MLPTLTLSFSRRFRVTALLVVLGAIGGYSSCTQLGQLMRSRQVARFESPQSDRQLIPLTVASRAADEGASAQPASAHQAVPVRPIERKIIRNGSFALTVKSFDAFFAELQQQVSSSGGFVAQVQANRGSGTVSAAQIIVRVFPDKVDAFTSWLRGQGTLTSEHLTSEDITEHYFDLQARLQNARRFETRLLEMLRTQTGKLQDLVLVEEKLNQIREQIEQFEGKVRLYDNLSGLATLTLSVRVEEHYVVSNPPTFAETVAATWRHSTRNLREFLEALALVAVAVAPWIPLISVLGILIWIGQKRLLNTAS